MADDIIDRLRDSANWTGPLKLEAADEIERLQAALEESSRMEKSWFELVQAYKWSHSHLGEWPEAIVELVAENYLLRKELKAVRGE